MNGRDIHSFKQKALAWAASFEVCCVLDSNGYTDPYGKFDLLLAAGTKAELNAKSVNKFKELKTFYEQHQNWMFGLLGYDLKNETEQLHSSKPDYINFPELFFFVPQYLIAIKGDQIKVIIGDPGLIDLIEHTELDMTAILNGDKQNIPIQNRISKEVYLKTVKALQEHIARGDIYEVNFCQEFFAEHAVINPVLVYHKLSDVSPTPFAGFFKIRDQYILSASPERFLCKRGNKLISQPIKGTAKRSANAKEDQQIKDALRENTKEQAENVMIVDLVRNDLTKCAVKGSVKVDELFGIYGFPQVFQMISTISCELNPDIHFIDAIKHTFPMGSMTGAPKVKAMKLIEAHEFNKRGAYSGAFGYFSPEGEFDFNVIIRSILYDAGKQYLSFQVGGAITYVADAEAEYEECMLKASAIIQTLKP
ncbi:MAG: anthranilate synthase component I family protein [Candidatus Pedobacter colombiensis]|uniref:Anthranilate synthase component I family protein n=1 Tax=Candidatus Pedobacter colombiensis TaxID=3121371 RepID=A0AAJ6B6S2_9SPHI|nr:anthranilate synthase component I family protein [Pedobacter sp.]WEK20327.1 MAG: anthranilate synthase component I family protein [Pedobacter sp.]